MRLTSITATFIPIFSFLMTVQSLDDHDHTEKLQETILFGSCNRQVSEYDPHISHYFLANASRLLGNFINF
jgi:hypothetical protein